ncbi:hypothetical protein BCR36DRAFT_579848 [Piromyces finnis]|uniref:Uncharacterized protein n=1 Tax=Piromyces finnis TaxID=1754191 RepID=A0A1Y1VLC0_9FUNG|nr:hypothetical protein BCR36DRAFT_579848 [Piromyces finnis]|eukprot:ORX59250.1 hypothetical protein BCR36DRAFT_579848 [Piromyces finnis]
MSTYNYEEAQYCFELLNPNNSDDVQEQINNVRRNVVLFIKPFTSQFFFWTLLLLILHRFNLRKPIIKIVVAHYIFRVIGDMLDSYGSRYTVYYHKNMYGECVADPVNKAEDHPLRWLITRQLAGIFWYSGEIVGDWYPLLRTKAVAGEQKEIWYVYTSCFIFNLSKITMMFYHFSVTENDMLIKKKEDAFYNAYWAIYLVSLCCSLLYDGSVYIAMKRSILKDTESINFGFLKKFRDMSEYRILVTAFLGLVGVPIMGVSAVLRLKYQEYDWSFEDLRIFLVNTSYFMMFIDQLMLFSYSKEEKSFSSNKDNKLFMV